MATYLINESMQRFRGAYQKVEGAESYAEVGSRTVFYDENGTELFAMKTEAIQTIKRQESPDSA